MKAVLLLNLGGPDDLEAVEPFLANLLSDVILLPWGKLGTRTLGKFIAARRTPFAQKLYNEIGGGSPILKETNAQAEALQALLGEDYVVFVAMRYSSPTIDEIQLEILSAGTEWEEIIVLPLFPQYSFATTRTCYAEWSRNTAFNGVSTFVHSYHDHPNYIAAIRDQIKVTIADGAPGVEYHILFSAHGLPVSYITKGDKYQQQIEETVSLVMEGLPNEHTLAYQSKVGPGKWLAPATPDAITSLAASGVKQLAVVPIAFVCEHLETLHELDLRMNKVAGEAGIKSYLRVPALGVHPEFIKALADIIENRVRYAA